MRILITAVLLLVLPLLAASLVATQPYDADRVFNQLKLGQLWSEKARFVDDWYAVEAIDAETFIIGEPKSSQYNSSYLIVGEQRALLIDAGSGERPDGIRNMRALAESLTGKPVTLALSHFHFDHMGDLEAFDGAVLTESAELRKRAGAIGNVVQAGAHEVLTGERAIRVAEWVASGQSIDLGNRRVELRTTPGHAEHSTTFIDRERRYVFTGDFLYQHLGGLVAFLPGSDVKTYAAEIDRLLASTGDSYRYFGAHGLQEFGAEWTRKVQQAMHSLAAGSAKTSLGESYLAPHLPLRMHRDEQLLVYMPPVVEAKTLYTWSFAASLLAGAVVLSLLMWRALSYRRARV